MAVSSFNRFLAFLAAHERSIGAGLFALGFLTDLLTFGLLPAEVVSLFFLTYLGLAAVTVFGTQFISAYKAKDAWWRKSLAVLFPLAAQYAFGGLFSGFVVFYARSSVVSVSWPFLLLLAAMYFGNEYFRMHKQHLVFQTVLFFFALYAYLIFALPLYLGQIGPFTFLGSTAVALSVFALFLWLLYLVNKKRLEDHVRPITFSSVGVALAMCLSYFTGLIPPLPLALVEEGIYHSVEKVQGGYVVTKEAADPWWDVGPETIESTGGTLSVFSSVRAPFSFSSNIVHRWEKFVPGEGWQTEGKIAFPLSGGRAEGYRGYSTKQVEEGKWRVSVETANGQAIGRIRFDVKETNVVPLLIEETL